MYTWNNVNAWILFFIILQYLTQFVNKVAVGLHSVHCHVLCVFMPCDHFPTFQKITSAKSYLQILYSILLWVLCCGLTMK